MPARLGSAGNSDSTGGPGQRSDLARNAHRPRCSRSITPAEGVAALAQLMCSDRATRRGQAESRQGAEPSQINRNLGYFIGVSRSLEATGGRR